MSWLDLPRVPEPEMMDDSDEVAAYASAASQSYLEKLDDTFVEHALRLVRGRAAGRALDIGCGPGQIVHKLAARMPGWQFTGADRAPNMIAQARKNQAPPGQASSGAEASPNQPPGPGAPAARALFNSRVEFLVADGNRLPFPDVSFDLVTSNSVLHHLRDPGRVLAEAARLAKPGGAILVRDLRRPLRLAYSLHIRWHGRHYSGLMYKLYCDSVRSAYTARELEELLRRSPLEGASIFLHRRTHMGIQRAIG
jgi:ubiquinone/menaquinone biosynthesis C-methylase UbiE